MHLLYFKSKVGVIVHIKLQKVEDKEVVCEKVGKSGMKNVISARNRCLRTRRHPERRARRKPRETAIAQPRRENRVSSVKR